MMAFLVRFVIVCISFLLSAAVCATVFYILKQQGQGIDPLTIEPKTFLYAVGGYLLNGLKLSFKLGPLYIFGPILIAILLGFLLRIRTIFYYVPAGGLAILAIPISINYAQTSLYTQPDENSIMLYMSAGAAAGFFYWLIGGANAVPKKGVKFF